MAVEWNTQKLPLKNFYGVNIGFEDNAETTNFSSGRVISFQKNSKTLKNYSVSYMASKQQAADFVDWYENTLGGNGNTFTITNLKGDNKTVEYRFTATPTISGQALKEIKLQFAEV